MNRPDRATFNLLDRPWIPVRDLKGQPQLVSLRSALLESERWLEVRDSSPLVTASLLRLLLAVLHRTIERADDDDAWLEHWARGTWNIESVWQYLDQEQDHFDLFHPTRPFFQVADLGIRESKWVPVTNLGLEFASGNNDTLFDHSHDHLAVSWPADKVARYLVATQSFALCGGRSCESQRFGTHPNRSNAPCVGRVLAFIRGGNLFQTLALNLVASPNQRLTHDADVAEDCPPWELDSARLLAPGPRAIRGVVDYLTWSSRAVLLHPDAECSVARIELTSLHALPRDLGWRDPWALHRASGKPPGHVPVPYRADRALWRDSHALVPAKADLTPEHILRLRRIGPSDIDMSLVRVDAIGLANVEAKAFAWRHDELHVPRAVLREPERRLVLEQGLEDIDRVARQLDKSLHDLAYRLLALGGKQPPRATDVSNFVGQLGAMPRFWAQLDAPFASFVRGLVADDPEPAREAFATTARRLAQDVFETSSDGCLGRGRRELRARAELTGHLRSLLRTRHARPAGSTA